ncbi:hypothetical protein [Actinospongicola halichondriae]|uniref:hypothetical protein n=1 Tax=Actinospongicola halichondriae TaxID=3236844 RepID=UPI003D41E798
MKLRRILASGAMCAVVIGGVGIDAAGAGKPEGVPRGQVERGPEHARSICSFSGLNDDPDAEFPEGGQVQSYGQAVRLGLKAFLDELGETPGALCNPAKGIDLHGGGGGH